MSNMNIPEISVTNVVKELATIYTAMIKGNIPYSSMPTPFLWGPPGVGKSDAVSELAEVLEKETGKRVKVTDIRLLLFSPTDLRGVPVADKEKRFTNWLKPRVLEFDSSQEVVNLLFLDELSAAPPSVQAAAYQLTLNRAIGEHPLPDNTIVIAAGNRATDRAVVYKMPSALANRMIHFDISVDFNGWKSWAVEKGNVHPMVLGFLSYSNDKLYIEERSIDDVAFPTPRSWVLLSNLLNLFGENIDIDLYYTSIAGLIGEGTAIEFLAWCKAYKDLPKIEDILAGKQIKLPKTPDALYALISSMTTYVSRREQDVAGNGLSNEEMENICKCSAGMPADYATSFFLNILAIDTVKLKLMKSPSFMAWGKQHKRVLTLAGY